MPQTDTNTANATAEETLVADTSQQQRVRVWFGSEIICSHTAAPAEAERYSRLMARRFAGLTVTIDDEPGETDHGLPHPLLWEQTVR